MQTILCFAGGRRERGVVLALDRDKMRVALPCLPDTLELRSVSGLWISDSGEPVEVEALLAKAEPAVLRVGRCAAASCD